MGGYELGEDSEEGEEGTAMKAAGLLTEWSAHSANIIRSSLSSGTQC